MLGGAEIAALARYYCVHLPKLRGARSSSRLTERERERERQRDRERERERWKENGDSRICRRHLGNRIE